MIFDRDQPVPEPDLAGGRRPLDHLIAAAGGAPLPGRLGLVQALLGVWSNTEGPKPLWVTRNALNTLGAIKEYRNAKRPYTVSKVVDPLTQWRLDNGYDRIPHTLVESIAPMVKAYVQALFKPESLKLTDQTSIDVYSLSPACSIAWASTASALQDGRAMQYGPFIDCEPETLFDAVREIIWENEGRRLFMGWRIADRYSGAKLIELRPADPPGDYIDVANKPWANVRLMSTRCRAFLDKGASRTILFQGPPGTGKSTLAMLVAGAIGAGRSLHADPSVFAGDHHQLELHLKVLQPDVLVIDDIDRGHLSTADVLRCTAALNSRIVTLITCNSVKALDPALCRPGRIDAVYEVSEPEEDQLQAIIEHYARRAGVEIKSEGHLTSLVREMYGFSPAEVRELMLCASVVGIDSVGADLKRIRKQREIYSGASCDNFLTKGGPDLVNGTLTVGSAQ